MKRWNFKGLRASHGVSVSHRSAGATGAHQVGDVPNLLSTIGKLDMLLGSWSCLAWQKDGRSARR